MKRCRKCGNILKENARYCGECGTMVTGDDQLGVGTIYEPKDLAETRPVKTSGQGHMDASYDEIMKRDTGLKSPEESELEGKKQGHLNPDYRPRGKRQGSLEEDRIRAEQEAEVRSREELRREEQEREERRRRDLAQEEQLWEERRREEEYWDRRRRENVEREERLRRERIAEEKRLEEERIRLEQEKKKRSGSS